MSSVASLVGALQDLGPTAATDPATAAAVASLIQQLIDALPALTGDRYVSIFCFTLSIWELILNFDNEVRLIWRSQQKQVLVTQMLYGFLRYSMILLSTLNLIVVCNITPQRGDIMFSWIIILAAIGNLTLIFGNARLAHQAYSLWDARHKTKIVIQTTLLISYSATIGCTIYSVISLARNVIFVGPIVHSCVVQTLPQEEIWVWVTQMVFDVFIFCYTLFNTRERQQVTADIISRFRKDCLFFFAILFALRLMNLVLATTRNVSYFTLGYLVDFVFVNIIMTRLILRLEYLKLSHNDRLGYEQRTRPEIELHVVSAHRDKARG
ncbi:unnamed protein product [Peniophora sp. CBMAI 1063]|nr:unnamed protein product [Peniophora sp. CBMAI 1063]